MWIMIFLSSHSNKKTANINQKYLINNCPPMKPNFYLLFSILLMLGSLNAFAQIGIGTTTPAASAALEVTSSSNNKGILIPRITASQKDAILSPAQGLLVYQTTAPIGFYYYSGTAWKLMANATDLSATGNAGTATRLAASKNINGVVFDGSADITVPAAAETLTGSTLKSTITGSSLTSVGTLANLTVTNPIVGSVTGNAGTATTATTVTTNANLTGDVTSVGNATTIGDNAVTTAKIANSAVKTTSIADGAITNAKITDVAATKITGTLPVANGGTGAAALIGLVKGNGIGSMTAAVAGTDYLTPTGSAAGLTNFPIFNQNTTGNAATATLATSVTTNANLTGPVTSVGNATTITDGAITNAKITDVAATKITGNFTSATVNGKVIVGASSAASASAVLEASSTTQGFLPPRMTTAQIAAITSPATGLLVWCSDCGLGELNVYNGTAWKNITGGAKSAVLTVGQSFQGGTIAYILVSGDPGYVPNATHGLIAATSDQTSGRYNGIKWYNSNFGLATGATGTAIGTGLSNTNSIITIQGATSTSYAAGLARAYTGGGYTDWYLPSIDELYKLALNRDAIGGFCEDCWYWSSSQLQSSPTVAYDVGFFNNNLYTITQNSISSVFQVYAPFSVRAIRSF